jgi:hypothetical protein
MIEKKKKKKKKKKKNLKLTSVGKGAQRKACSQQKVNFPNCA